MESNKTLRDAIIEGLGYAWTKELEDALFWPLSDFMIRVGNHRYQEGKEDNLKALREAGIIK